MTLTRLLTAAGFAAMLAAGSAYAQSTDTDTTVSVDTQGNTTTTTTTTGMPGTVTTRTVTNGPVPDTAENRARYGQPLSRAGKRTAPAGN